LQTAREVCNVQYPMRVGNYLPHANCVNAAIKTYALQGARYPDLIRLQAQVRAALSAKIDSRRITIQAGMLPTKTASVRSLFQVGEHDGRAWPTASPACSRRHRQLYPHQPRGRNANLARGISI